MVDAIIITKIFVFDIIYYVASAVKLKLLFNNHLIWTQYVASGDPENWKKKLILVAVAK